MYYENDSLNNSDTLAEERNNHHDHDKDFNFSPFIHYYPMPQYSAMMYNPQMMYGCPMMSPYGMYPHMNREEEDMVRSDYRPIGGHGGGFGAGHGGFGPGHGGFGPGHGGFGHGHGGFAPIRPFFNPWFFYAPWPYYDDYYDDCYGDDCY